MLASGCDSILQMHIMSIGSCSDRVIHSGERMLAPAHRCPQHASQDCNFAARPPRRQNSSSHCSTSGRTACSSQAGEGNSARGHAHLSRRDALLAATAMMGLSSSRALAFTPAPQGTPEPPTPLSQDVLQYLKSSRPTSAKMLHLIHTTLNPFCRLTARASR